MQNAVLYNRFFKSLAGLAILAAAVSCNKQLDALSPNNVNFEDQQFLTPNGYTKATIGNYAYLAGPSSTTSYESYWFNLSEFRSNNVKFIDVTSTSSSSEAASDVDAFNFTNTSSKDFGYSNAFWQASYQALLGVNTVLKHVDSTATDPTILQAKAENLFLRAVINFNLVRLYGMPYYQSPENNPGIPIILEPITSFTPPLRATVKQTYDQIIRDLTDATGNFTQKKVNSYASRYAVFALLSRVYLYMSGTFSAPNAGFAKLSQQYADSVILNGGYSLLQGTAYANYYNNSNQANTETVWAMNNDGVTSFLPRLLNVPGGTYTGNTGYSTGQAKVSPDFLSLLATGDLRWNFYKTDKYPNNNTDTLGCMKYLYKYVGVYYSYAPVHYLRLAEVYLNRAEAKVKQGDNSGALTDLNVIHTRAGLAALAGLSGQALFDAILTERRLELAFEGHSSFDYFRNGLPMVRNYNSFNSPALTVNPTEGKVIMRISDDVLAENPNIKQNPQ